jgi:hypothetical protein
MRDRHMDREKKERKREKVTDIKTEKNIKRERERERERERGCTFMPFILMYVNASTEQSTSKAFQSSPGSFLAEPTLKIIQEQGPSTSTAALLNYKDKISNKPKLQTKLFVDKKTLKTKTKPSTNKVKPGGLTATGSSSQILQQKEKKTDRKDRRQTEDGQRVVKKDTTCKVCNGRKFGFYAKRNVPCRVCSSCKTTKCGECKTCLQPSMKKACMRKECVNPILAKCKCPFAESPHLIQGCGGIMPQNFNVAQQ